MRRLGLWLICFATMAAAVSLSATAHAQTLWDRARHPELRDLDHNLARGRSLLDAARRAEYQTPRPPPIGVRERLVRDAHVIFSAAVELAPDHVGALLGLAEALEAEQGIEEGRRDPADESWLRVVRDALSGPDRYGEALALLERAEAHVGEGPELADVLFRLGVLYTRRQRFLEARDAYLRFVTLALPNHSRAVGLCNLAETYVYLSDLERAVRTYNECVSVEPGNAGAWWGLASAADRDGRGGDAHEAALQALIEDPDLQDLVGPHVFYVPAFDRYYYLGIAHEIAGRTTEALLAWRRYLSDGGASSPWADRARGHIARLEVLGRETTRRAARSPH